MKTFKATITKIKIILLIQKSLIRCNRLGSLETFRSINKQGFPGGAVVKNLSANAGDTSLNPGLGRSHMPQSN